MDQRYIVFLYKQNYNIHNLKTGTENRLALDVSVKIVINFSTKVYSFISRFESISLKISQFSRSRFLFYFLPIKPSFDNPEQRYIIAQNSYFFWKKSAFTFEILKTKPSTYSTQLG